MAGADRHSEGSADARGRAQAARGGVQHVLLRPAAAAAAGRRAAASRRWSRRWDRGYIQSAADRFQFDTLQRRFQTFVDLWDRGLRSREEGRAGPFAQPPPKATRRRSARRRSSKVVHVTAFRDPMREMDKLHTLYDSLMDARREAGRRRGAVPPLRGAGQGSGREGAATRRAGSGVPRGGERREGELYGAGGEGSGGRWRSVRRPTPERPAAASGIDTGTRRAS